jgi:chromosome segregation ATPase
VRRCHHDLAVLRGDLDQCRMHCDEMEHSRNAYKTKNEQTSDQLAQLQQQHVQLQNACAHRDSEVGLLADCILYWLQFCC